MVTPRTRDVYHLPPRLFLYTLDQISDLLMVDNLSKFLHKEGITPGTPKRDRMLARNIAPSGEKPEWRVEEDEFIRWMRHMKIVPLRR